MTDVKAIAHEANVLVTQKDNYADADEFDTQAMWLMTYEEWLQVVRRTFVYFKFNRKRFEVEQAEWLLETDRHGDARSNWEIELRFEREGYGLATYFGSNENLIWKSVADYINGFTIILVTKEFAAELNSVLLPNCYEGKFGLGYMLDRGNFWESMGEDLYGYIDGLGLSWQTDEDEFLNIIERLIDLPYYWNEPIPELPPNYVVGASVEYQKSLTDAMMKLINKLDAAENPHSTGESYRIRLELSRWPETYSENDYDFEAHLHAQLIEVIDDDRLPDVELKANLTTRAETMLQRALTTKDFTEVQAAIDEMSKPEHYNTLHAFEFEILISFKEALIHRGETHG